MIVRLERVRKCRVLEMDVEAEGKMREDGERASRGGGMRCWKLVVLYEVLR